MRGRITCYWQVHFTFDATISKPSMETTRDFEPCEAPENAGFLCLEEDAAEERVRDQFGNDIHLTENGYDGDDAENEIDADNDDDEGGLNATNNTSHTRQDGYGATLQATFTTPLIHRENQFITGASFDRGGALFNAETELASLTPDRGTIVAVFLIANLLWMLRRQFRILASMRQIPFRSRRSWGSRCQDATTEPRLYCAIKLV